MSEEKSERKDKGSVNIGSIKDISGGTLNIAGGDINQESERGKSRRTINTSGGTYIEGSVNTGGGDFVGRDKIVNFSQSSAHGPSPFDQIRSAVVKIENRDLQATMLNAVSSLEKEADKGPGKENPDLVKIWLTVLMTSSPDFVKSAVRQAFSQPGIPIGKTFFEVLNKL